jgi:hypothetical protein
MNERVEQFARECGAWNQVYGNRTFMIDEHFDIEKFAELIVRECAGLLEKDAESNYDEGTDVYDKLILESKWIKQHFGVEELKK